MIALFLNAGATYGQNFKIVSQRDELLSIDPRYHTYEEVVAELDSIANEYPNMTMLDSIGISTTDSTIIWALKVSDNPFIEEDEPAVLYNGVHHAEELLGAEICMYMIHELITGYDIDPQITSWVDSTEIWLVPVVNPDGHEIVMTDIDTMWRKNTRDNNENDTFDLDYDGVDLNRNYDFNWGTGGSTNPGSEYYRGPYPFSELETQAMRNLSEEQKFIFAVNYHSARTGQGEVIYYPWTWYGQYSPDHAAISEVADSMASLIVNDGGTGTYQAIVASATYGGLARHWQYGAQGAFGFTVEVSTTCAPPGSLVNDICERNLVGAYYLLVRIYGSSITGCITDSATGEPLEAEVRILEAYDPDLPPRSSDSTYGRYRRILVAETYTVQVSKEGYYERTISDVEVFEDEPTILDVQLAAIPTVIYDSDNNDVTQIFPERYDLLQNYPNPFNDKTTIKFQIADFKLHNNNCCLNIYDVSGRLVKSFLLPTTYSLLPTSISWNGENDRGRKVPGGIYFYQIQAGDYTSTKNMILLR